MALRMESFKPWDDAPRFVCALLVDGGSASYFLPDIPAEEATGETAATLSECRDHAAIATTGVAPASGAGAMSVSPST
jgi:hypothetical protein